MSLPIKVGLHFLDSSVALGAIRHVVCRVDVEEEQSARLHNPPYLLQDLPCSLIRKEWRATLLITAPKEASGKGSGSAMSPTWKLIDRPAAFAFARSMATGE